jgi:N-methylhydantoinase A/oxoprolinase/acetone carboxylase beta subunit
VGALVGVDVGGTFTDVAVLHDGRLAAAKVPTTPDDQSRGVLEGVSEALALAGCGARAVDVLGHGTTVATNALLERRGARTGFVATRGFGDLLTLRRQARPHLYRPCQAPPPPLAEIVAEVDERCTPAGRERALDEASVGRAARRLRRAGVEAVAVCLLHSYAHPAHEARTAELLADALPGVPVVASHRSAGEFREYERASTAVADAYLAPPTGRYLRELAAAAQDMGLPPALVMQSSGGLCTIDEAAAHPARLLLSGPAGGVAAVAALADADAISFDMGGTSCDVALVRDGRPSRSVEQALGGLPVRLPGVDVHTVGAGGGSIAWLDAGGALRVGPRSAGAVPGPACYGRGGTDPTVTDANVLLGRLPADAPLAGRVRLDRRRAEAAFAGLAGALGGLEAAARGVIAVANAEMVRAIRVVSVEQGHDPARCELVAFGGAGPLHACDVADELGIRTVVAPAAGGVLSALGIAAGERRRDAVASVLRPLAELRGDDLHRLAPAIPRTDGEHLTITVDARYRGQAFELEVDGEPLDGLAERFARRHEARYGFADEDGEIEIVNVRASAVAPAPRLPAPARPPGGAVAGPAVVHLDGATLWVAAGWTGHPAPGEWRVTR